MIHLGNLSAQLLGGRLPGAGVLGGTLKRWVIAGRSRHLATTDPSASLHWDPGRWSAAGEPDSEMALEETKRRWPRGDPYLGTKKGSIFVFLATKES